MPALTDGVAGRSVATSDFGGDDVGEEGPVVRSTSWSQPTATIAVSRTVRQRSEIDIIASRSAVVEEARLWPREPGTAWRVAGKLPSVKSTIGRGSAHVRV